MNKKRLDWKVCLYELTSAFEQVSRGGIKFNNSDVFLPHAKQFTVFP